MTTISHLPLRLIEAMGGKNTTSITVSRATRNELYYLKRPTDSWDDMFQRLLAEVDAEPSPAVTWGGVDG